MSVVVIIPVYNRAQTVLEAVGSVADQNRPPDRLIVVDDGSTDNFAERFEQWSASRRLAFPVELIRQPNRGAAAARNRGIQAAPEARWFAFLDSDDLWPSDFLQRTLAALQASPEAVAVTCDRRVIDVGEGQATHVGMAELAINPTRWLFVHGAAVASASVFRADSIRRLHGFKATLKTGEDSELFLRLSCSGEWLHVPGEPALYRRGLARSRGESDHVRHQRADYLRRWAEIRQDFLEHEGRRLAAVDSCYRVEMAKRWQRAAKYHLACGETEAARQCWRRALRWRWSAKAVLRLAGSYLRRAG